MTHNPSGTIFALLLLSCLSAECIPAMAVLVTVAAVLMGIKSAAFGEATPKAAKQNRQSPKQSIST